MPTAILLGVTGVSRAPALVIDVQDGYFDRLLLTPVRRLAILLGHLVADVTVAAALTVPILIVGFILGVRFETGPARHRGVHPDRRAVEPRVLGLRLRDRAEDREPGGGELDASCCSSRSCSSRRRTCRASQLVRLARRRSPRWNPVTYLLEGLRSLVIDGWDAGDLGEALARDRDRRRDQHDAVLRGAARAHPPRLRRPT